MKNRKLTISLSIISAICYFGADLDVKQRPERRTEITQTRQVERKDYHRVIVTTKETKTPAPKPHKKPFPSSLHQYRSSPHPSLPSNFEFAEEIFAVKTKDYKESLGIEIERKNGYVFVHSQIPNQEANKVVIERPENKLYLVSSVIKLTNINSTKRDKILSTGMEEHSYDKDLKIMIVQTSQDDLIRTHDELRYLRFDPRIKILKGYRRSL